MSKGWADRVAVRAQLDAVVGGVPFNYGTGLDWKSRPSGYSHIGNWSWGNFGGERIDAAEALRIGLVSRVVEPEQLQASAEQLAQKIAGNAPLSNYAITQALPRIADLSASDGLFMETLMASIAQGDDAAKERVRAFLEKRAAKVAKS